METEIGALIMESRGNLALTQDQFGRKYGVSGPAIFKFEKSYVKPSLDLWLRMAQDMRLTEQTAVLMWVKAKLPKKYQSFINPEAPAPAEEKPVRGRKKASAAPKAADAKDARKRILADAAAPRGLKQLLQDEDIWALYKPTGAELLVLRDVFGQLGNGSKSSFREALRLAREFSNEV